MRIFVVDLGISTRSKRVIGNLIDNRRISIKWINPSNKQHEIIQSLPAGFVGRNCYYKLFIPELLGEACQKSIYLDSDVIVEDDLFRFWSQETGGQFVLAAQDLINPYVSSPFGVLTWKEDGRDERDLLFNSGVLLVNLEKWRSEKVIPRFIEYLKQNYSRIQLCDQDAMNAVFRNQWKRIDPLWNVLPYMPEAADFCLHHPDYHHTLLDKAFILHFCGTRKPWKGGCSHPRRGRFFHYLDMTGWAGWRPRRWTGSGNTLIYYFRRAKKFFLRDR